MIHIYTDGACKGNPGIGGYAFRIINSNTIIDRSYGVNIVTTNNRMELMAVISAMRYMFENGSVENTKCTVYSDSTYVTDAFTQNRLQRWVSNKFRKIKNVDLWLQLLEISNYFKVTFIHVPGHSGEINNETVNALASDACGKNGLVIANTRNIK